ncbi:cupin domain-containing protein [Mycobacteroides chelonae]|uniref:cupin domain-containing protein n=1 Tax=Mycobacteroides chelonae TaxID=1774 RepID=UPI003AACA07C
MTEDVARMLRTPWSGRLAGGAQEMELVVSRHESHDQLSMVRNTLKPEDAPPLHVHSREDEFWIVLSGEVKFWVGGRTLQECSTLVAGAGSVVFGPRNIPHTFQTYTPSALVMGGASPAQIEDLFFSAENTVESGVNHGLSPERFVTEYGIEILDRPPVYQRD